MQKLLIHRDIPHEITLISFNGPVIDVCIVQNETPVMSTSFSAQFYLLCPDRCTICLQRTNSPLVTINPSKVEL